jgi:NADH-quinone oxidoreductase subunit N
MGYDFLLIAPELVLTVGGLLLLMQGAFGRQGDGNATFAHHNGALYLFAAIVLLFLVPGTGEAFQGTYRADAFSRFAKILIYGSSIVALLLAPTYFKKTGILRAEYAALVVFAAMGMGIMVSATDLLGLYIGVELNSLAAYVLASFARQDERSSEAGLKYFVLGALASGILLFGLSLLYGFSGTLRFDGIALAFDAGMNPGLLFGLVFVLAGLCFKISAVPFHMWTPDVYEGAPTPVTLFFASAPKVAGMALMVRVTYEALGSNPQAWQQVIAFVAIASTVLGAAGAIGQANIKRLLAYSSINNIGFALIGLAAANKPGAAAVLTYMAVYVVMTLGSFACVLRLRDKDGNYDERISTLAGLSKRRPGLSVALAFFMFSLAGIPPLFGFWPKLLVFDAAVQAGLLPLAVIGVLTTVIGAYYYIRIIKMMYFDDAEAEAPVSIPSRVETGVIVASAVAISPLGYLLIPALGAATATAAAALF